MNPNLPVSLGSIPSLFRHPLALLGGVLLCLAPALAPAQSVSFAGTQTTLPFSDLHSPEGVVLDGAGDVFICDTVNNRVLELPRTATGYGPQATLPFTGLKYPGGITMDSAGDLFIGDYYTNDVVELPKTSTGYGPQITLPFTGLSSPWGVAVDSSGDVFVTNQDNNSVVELPWTGTGYGSQITLPFSGLGGPVGIAVDSAGDVFVANWAGSQSVVELPKTSTGYGPQTTLPFSGLSRPFGVALDSAGDVFIAENWPPESALELPKTATGYGQQTTLAATGLFNPEGVALDSAGDLFIGDTANYRVVEVQTQSVNFGGVNICPAGQTTPAPCSETMTLNFTVTASGTLGTPHALTLGAQDLDFTVASGSTCTGAVTEGSTCTVNVTFAPRFAGLRRGGVHVVASNGEVLADVPVYGIGTGPQVTFQPGPVSTLPGFIGGPGINTNLAVDGSGNVFVCNDIVHEIVAAGGYTMVNALDSNVANPVGIAVDGSGNVFVNDYNYDALQEILATGGYTTVKTVAAIQAWGLAIDGSGNIFATEAYNGPVVEILAAGGYTAVKTLTAAYSWASGVAVDGNGNLFVADTANERVQEILAAGGYTTVNTLPGSQGIFAWGVAVDASGNVFAADYGDGAVKEILAAGGYTTVKTLAAGYPYVTGVAVDGSGDVYFAAGPDNGIRIWKLDYADPPSVVFPTATAVGTEDTADGPQTVSVWNSGNQPLLFSTLDDSNNPSYEGDFHENISDDSLCTSGLELAPGTSCDVSINFLPSADGVNTGKVVLADNALNGNPAKQHIPVSGTGTTPPPGAQVSPNPLEFGAIAFGTTKTLPLTITNTGGSTLTITPPILPGFTIQSSTCSAGVAAGGSCVLQVQYSPPSFGVHGVFMTLLTNGATNPVVKLSGETIGVGVTATVLDFGTIPFGTTETLPLIVTSYGVSGTVPITFSVNGTSFTVPAAGNTCLNGVGSGQSCTLQVQFSPTTVGQHEHTLSVQSSYGTVSVLLKGAASQP